MKTIALLSGGKDSILAVLMAYRYGHTPAVVVNVVPALPADVATGAAADLSETAEGHDIDSYMYQTVGFEAVDAIAACLGVPLRRVCVKRGRARDQSLLYSAQPPADDEVETLFHLLSEVRAEFPEVRGITSGAILSNYQRNRVEFICDRLGMESLAYLWMRQPSEILDMAHELGVRAILVKTASIGLAPRRLIGKTLEEARPTLERMTELYQSHLAGEGGEYETTVLNCPLFPREQLVVTGIEVVMQDDNDISPSGHGLLSVAREEKPAEQRSEEAALLARLRAGDFHFPSDVMPLLQHLSATVKSLSRLSSIAPPESSSNGQPEGFASVSCSNHGCEPALFEATLPDCAAAEDRKGSVETAVSTCLAEAEAWAAQHAVSPFFFHVHLPHLSDEAACRAAYERHVSHVCPPSLLVTAHSADAEAVAAAPGAAQRVQVLMRAAPSATIQQNVLHAQSRSCWAVGEPGPYAQARRVGLPSGDALLFVTAVAGRVPATREVAKAADLPQPCRERLLSFLTTSCADEVGEEANVGALADAAAELLFAMANCGQYLALYKHSLVDVSEATVLVAAAVPRWLVLSLWQWCTGMSATKVQQVCSVKCVAALSRGECLRVAMQVVEALEDSLDD